MDGHHKPASAMSPEELCAIGEEIFGRYGWQTALARAIGVDGSTVRRWKAGTMAMSHEHAERIRQLLREHRGKLVSALAEHGAFPDDAPRIGAQAPTAARGAEQRAARPAEPTAVSIVVPETWHRRALQLLAAVGTLGDLLRREGRGDARGEVMDVMGRLVVRVTVAADGNPPEVRKIAETDGLEALAETEARVHDLLI